MIIVKAKETKKGISIVMGDKSSDISYPSPIWEKFPKNLKEVLLDNLVYSKTMVATIVDGISMMEYNTSTPLLKSFFDTCCIKDLPRMPTDRNNGLKTDELVKKFVNSEYKFLKDGIKYPHYDAEAEEGAVIGFSFGKDSLLSYALLEEAGVKELPVYIKDMFDYEATIKDNLKTRFEKEFNKKIELVQDSSDKLFLGKHDHFNPLLTNAINSYTLMMLPFAHYHNYKYVAFGNERNLNYNFTNKDGFKGYASYDQTAEWVKQQTAFMSILTANKIKVFSPIEPIHNLATMKILNSRYPQYAKYQMTCPGDVEPGNLWCGRCSECAKIFAILKAINVDPKERGFKRNMLSKENKRFFSLFDGEEVMVYDKPKDSRDEQLLTFYMAYKNKAEGELIEKFKKNFLKEAKQREDELYRKYMNVDRGENIPADIRKRIMPILKEELK
jgi:hypothetical protein